MEVSYYEWIHVDRSRHTYLHDPVHGCYRRFLLLLPDQTSEKRAERKAGNAQLTGDRDTVIVEFGNNKNCRIPMQKAAIVQIEKPEDALETADDK